MLLIMVFGENMIEHGRLGKRCKPKSCDGKPTEFRSPNFLVWLYKLATASEDGNRSTPSRRLHLASRSHLMSAPWAWALIEKKYLDPGPYRAGRD